MHTYILSKQIKARAGEIDYTNNLYAGGAVKIRCIGDVTDDGSVNIFDVAVAGAAFGSFPEHPRWNPLADLDNNGITNIFDIAIIAADFGKTV